MRPFFTGHNSIGKLWPISWVKCDEFYSKSDKPFGGATNFYCTATRFAAVQ
jgi:hypothetical protein